MCDRKDRSLEVIVDEAIVMFENDQREQAITLLIEHRVPPAVMKRILYFPEQRRQYINDYLSGY